MIVPGNHLGGSVGRAPAHRARDPGSNSCLGGIRLTITREFKSNR